MSLTRSRDFTSDEYLARTATVAPRIPWDDFLTRVFVWRPGEHIALIGPTGQGKTTLLMNILPLHPFVTVFATKPKDETMNMLIESDGYVKLDEWRELDPRHYPKRVIWPDAHALDSVAKQRVVFHDAFDRIYREGHWTLAVDETWYIANTLKLGGDLKLILMQARSMKICLVTATQRPSAIPLEIYDQSTHLFFFRDNDEANLKRLSGISWRSADLVRGLIANLEEHQVLYVNTRTGFMCRTRCPASILTANGEVKYGSA